MESFRSSWDASLDASLVSPIVPITDALIRTVTGKQAQEQLEDVTVLDLHLAASGLHGRIASCSGLERLPALTQLNLRRASSAIRSRSLSFPLSDPLAFVRRPPLKLTTETTPLLPPPLPTTAHTTTTPRPRATTRWPI